MGCGTILLLVYQELLPLFTKTVKSMELLQQMYQVHTQEQGQLGQEKTV